MNAVSSYQSFSFLQNISEIPSITRAATRSFGYLVSLGRLPIGLYGLATVSFLKEQTVFGSIGAVLLVPADIGGTIVFFERVGLIEITANFSIYVAVVYFAAYVPILIDSICVLTDDKKALTIKRQAVLNLANAIAQIALATFIIIGYSHPTLIVPIIVVAGLFGSLSFLYRHAVLATEQKRE